MFLSADPVNEIVVWWYSAWMVRRRFPGVPTLFHGRALHRAWKAVVHAHKSPDTPQPYRIWVHDRNFMLITLSRIRLRIYSVR